MPDSWNPETYRSRAKAWQEEADQHPAGRERDACLVIAEGYARLAQLLEQRAPDILTSQGTTGSSTSRP